MYFSIVFFSVILSRFKGQLKTTIGVSG